MFAGKKFTCRSCRHTFVGSFYGRWAYFWHRLIHHRLKIRVKIDWGDGWIRQRKIEEGERRG